MTAPVPRELRELPTYSIRHRGSVYQVMVHRGEVEAVAATFMEKRLAEEAVQRFTERAAALNGSRSK